MSVQDEDLTVMSLLQVGPGVTYTTAVLRGISQDSKSFC